MVFKKSLNPNDVHLSEDRKAMLEVLLGKSTNPKYNQSDTSDKPAATTATIKNEGKPSEQKRMSTIDVIASISSVFYVVSIVLPLVFLLKTIVCTLPTIETKSSGFHLIWTYLGWLWSYGVSCVASGIINVLIGVGIVYSVSTLVTILILMRQQSKLKYELRKTSSLETEIKKTLDTQDKKEQKEQNE
jgi:hypothetical protein